MVATCSDEARHALGLIGPETAPGVSAIHVLEASWPMQSCPVQALLSRQRELTLLEKYTLRAFHEIPDVSAAEIANRLGKKYGEFYRGYAQLKLDTAFYNDAQTRWRQEQTRLRLITVAFVSLTVLALLTTTYGYLRLNQATRGFYSTRLLTIGIAAIMLLAAATIWLLQIFAL